MPKKPLQKFINVGEIVQLHQLSGQVVMGEKERDRQTDRENERERNRQTDRKKEREGWGEGHMF